MKGSVLLSRAAHNWQIPIVPLRWLEATIESGAFIPMAAHRLAGCLQHFGPSTNRSLTSAGVTSGNAGAQVCIPSLRSNASPAVRVAYSPLRRENVAEN
jgi:hypothetical protein